MALQRDGLEKALRKSLEFRSNLLTYSPNPIIVINLDTSVKYVNPALERLTGFSSAELIGCKAPYPWWTEETVQKTHNDLEKAMCEGAQKLEKLFQKKNGERFWVEITSAPIMSDGEFKYYLANWMDITERKQAEEALRESEKRYRMLFNSSNDAVIVHELTTEDMPGKISDVNEIACQKFGYTKEELLKLAYLDLIAPEQLEEVPKIREKLLTSGHSIFEITAVTKDNKKFPCEISTHLFEFKGQPTVLSIVRDITERKKHEKELDAHREHIKLINKILRHDIINDLSVIHSALRLYGRSKKKELLEEIAVHVNKSVELINRMKELESFIASHRDLERYSVTEVLNAVIERYPAIAFNIEGECQVLADESLSSVIDNLIRNAVVHGKTDRIDIKIGGRGEYCEIRIADYGIGIPDEIKGQIFEESFASGETAGTGLGLYIVKKALENYGGTVHVEDNRPGGAVFVLALMRVR